MQFQGTRAVFLTILLGLSMLAGLFVWSPPVLSQPGPTQQVPVVSIRATDSEVAEACLNPGEFTVYRTAPSSSALTVSYAVIGTATPGVDYVALSGNVTIAAGSSRATITVTPVDDGIVEGDETVIVILHPDPNSPPTYTVGSRDRATVTIVDDDVAQIRVAYNSIGRPWLYLWHQPSERLFQGPDTTGSTLIFFDLGRDEGRIHRGANATGEIVFTVSFCTGRVWAGPNTTGPLLYTLERVSSSRRPEIRVHSGNSKGPIIYTISDDDMYDGPNVIGPLVYHGSEPFRGPIQFLLPLLADHRIP